MERKTRRVLLAILIPCLALFLSHSFLCRQPSALSSEENTRIVHLLSVLSEQEQADLKALFDHFFFFDSFAYTLFGTKPMSMGRLLPTNQAKNGWQAWEKISPLIHSQRFVIQKHVYNGKEFIYIANLNEIAKIYQNNRALFPDHMTLDILYDSLKHKGPDFQLLINNDLLIGILLGYGTNNAQQFANHHALKTFSNILHPIFYYPSGIMPPSFACDPTTEETKALKLRYAQERKMIIKLSKHDPLFMHMLVLLTCNFF